MKLSKIPLVTSFYKDEDRDWSVQDCVNYLPTVSESAGTRSQMMLRTAPGLRPFVRLPGVGPVRGVYNCEGRLFAVMGEMLYQISNTFVAVPIGRIPGIQRVQFAHNQASSTGANQLVIGNGQAGYVYNTQTKVFERITDEGFIGGISPVFIDSYIVWVSLNRLYALNSSPANALEYSTLDQFQSEFSPDKLVALAVSSSELILMSETSLEFFQNTGATEQPFRTKQISLSIGLAGRFCKAFSDNTVFFLANDGTFRRIDNYTATRISTGPVEQAIRGLDWTQAYTYVWEEGRYKVVYWTFPDGKTFGWDIANQAWHRRESYGLNRWRVSDITKWNGLNIAGDFQDGTLWVVDSAYMMEGDQDYMCEISGPVIHADGNLAKMPRLDIIMQTGQRDTDVIEFPAQPSGPTITNRMPDGLFGAPWGPFTYAASGGRLPYTFSVRGGALPESLGVMNAHGLIPGGVVDELGDFTLQVRVTDANGLYEDISDTASFTMADIGLDWKYTGLFGSQIEDVTYGAGYFLAVGLGNSPDKQIWLSPTGDTGSWVQQATGVPAGWTFNSCAFGNGIFVVSRGFNNVLTGSVVSGSISWTQRTTANTDAYAVTIWSGQNFIRAGLNGSSEWSTNGVTWTNSPRPGSQAASVGVRHGNIVIILCGNGAIHRTSTNGVSWTTAVIASDPAPAQGFTGATSNGAIIRAYKYASSILYTYTSVDAGLNFTVQQDNVGSANYQAGKSLYRNGRWIGLGATTAGLQQVKLWYSTDGLPPWLPATVHGYVDTTAATMRAIAANEFTMAVLVGTKASAGYSMISPLI